MKIATVKKSKNKKLIVSVVSLLAVILLSISGYLVYAHGASTWPFNSTKADASNTPRPTNSVDYNPPSDQDVLHSQDAKKRATEQQGQSTQTGTTPSTQLLTASVGVSFADVIDGAIEVRAFTPSIVEGTGTCTATFTKGTLKLVRQSKAFIDSTTSQCQPIRVPLGDFSESGTWQLIVSYSSPKAQGQSEIVEVHV